MSHQSAEDEDLKALVRKVRTVCETGIADDGLVLLDADEVLRIVQAVEPSGETSVALTKCPYCERPADSEGGINHRGGCIGLEKIDLNRLQYNALVSRAFAAETTERHRGDEIDPKLAQQAWYHIGQLAITNPNEKLERAIQWVYAQCRPAVKAGEKHDG